LSAKVDDYDSSEPARYTLKGVGDVQTNDYGQVKNDYGQVKHVRAVLRSEKNVFMVKPTPSFGRKNGPN
jgi:hypothetical protein